MKRSCIKVSLVIEGEKPPSWNELWSQSHWTKRKEIKDRCALVMRAAVDPDKAFIFECKVTLEIRVYLKGKMMDWSNVCIKPYEDALIGLYLKDDSPKYVAGGTVRVYQDKKNPRIEIDINPV